MFPLIKNYYVHHYSMILSLECKQQNGFNLIRKYYSVTYVNDQELIFLTTNELDNSFTERVLDADFYLIDGFSTLKNEFEQSEHLKTISITEFLKVPKFLIYDIVFMEDYLKFFFKCEILEAIKSFTTEDFTSIEQFQIKKWLHKLNK